MCGVVYILLYYALFQSSLWLPDFNKLLVLSSSSLIALTSTVSACVGHSTADAQGQVENKEGRRTTCRGVVTDYDQNRFLVTGSVFGCSVQCLIIHQ